MDWIHHPPNEIIIIQSVVSFYAIRDNTATNSHWSYVISAMGEFAGICDYWLKLYTVLHYLCVNSLKLA